MNKKTLALILAIIVAALAIGFVVLRGRPDDPTATAPSQTVDKASITKTTKSFDKTKYSLSEPGSLWLVVNKSRPIPSGYAPALAVPNVRLRLGAGEEQMQFSKAAIPAVETMFKAATKDGVTLVFGSGYRSFTLQKSFYDSYVARDGQAAADRYSARPGTSEHQTGLAFDATTTNGTCHLSQCFEDTPEGRWLAAHAHEYGFTLRYKQDTEKITGYKYEPWHFRYVGLELAAELQKSNQTLEEFFDLD